MLNRLFSSSQKTIGRHALGLLLLVTMLAAAQGEVSDRFVIGGHIQVSETGPLYIYLVTRSQFANQGTGRRLLVQVNSEHVKVGSVAFSFGRVPPGTYGIRCFLDQNHNGKLDRGLFGPAEPWGMSFRRGRPTQWPTFDAVAFDAHEDNDNLLVLIE